MDQSLLDLTAEVVSGYVANNRTSAERLPALFQSVYQTFATARSAVATQAAKIGPAVPVKRSIFPDRVLCFACGQGFSVLKRHLGTEHQLMPEEYRARYELPHDYPLVAPDYAKVRSSLAKKIGLGRGDHARTPSRMTGRKRRP